MELPGIGNKTADVFLSFIARRNVIAVDTHMDWIAKRLDWFLPKHGTRRHERRSWAQRHLDGVCR
ncbi:MAG: hypothetical protein ACE5OY_00210 [Candidatus Bathyarchaeia archaeon]